MTDDENRQRPNANYKLSKPDGVNARAEEKLTFYYNRERRLEKAPQIVKDLYKDKESKQQNRFNLLRPLIADKPRATLFFTIVILCAFILVLSVLGYMDTSYSFEGNKLEISGTRYEGTTIVVIKKTRKKGLSTPYTGTVDIAVSPVQGGENEDMNVFGHRIFLTLEQTEEYRFVVPFDDSNLLMVLQSEKNTLKLDFKPQ